jgi:hypothetical protein
MRKTLPPINADDHAALVHLCKHKKLICRTDGYGTQTVTLMSRHSAIALKRRRLAVAGWDYDMYPTVSGRMLAAGNTNA